MSPLYSYRAMEEGEFVGKVHEELIHLPAGSSPPQMIMAQGVEMHRDMMSDFRGTMESGEHEYVSEAMAVHPNEIGDITADARKHGVEPKRYTADGSPVFSSAKHKKAYMRVYGYHDNNSYY